MKLKELLAGIEILETNAPMTLDVAGVRYASNQVQPGELFVAVPGYATDGHKYIPDAVRRGAAVILCEREMPMGTPWVRVASSRQALAKLGANWFGHPANTMQVIGVTGTNGKTSVTYLLKALLEGAVGAKVGLIGTICNELFFDKKCSAIEIAQIGQYAENVYFGKPCGLMDQMASSVGGLVFIDFADPAHPAVRQAAFDFAHCGYTLCTLDSGADHADLTDEYAAIPGEMRRVARVFGKDVLREVDEAEFYANLKAAREAAGDRAVLRAMHFFDENRRVQRQVQSLEAGDFEGFLAGVRESGRSSWMLLQNIIPLGSTAHQQMALAQALCEKLLDGRGACRVHGGGFAGTILAFVPDEMLGQFRSGCNGASARRIADRLQVVEKGQRLQQFGGVFGVFGREDGDVRRVAEVAAVEVEVDKLLEGLPADAHGWNSVYSTSFALRRWSART